MGYRFAREVCLIGACVAEPAQIGRCLYLTPEDFHSDYRRRAWSYIKDKFIHTGSLDVVEFATKFDNDPELKRTLEFGKSTEVKVWAQEIRSYGMRERIAGVLEGRLREVDSLTPEESIMITFEGLKSILASSRSGFETRGEVLERLSDLAMKKNVCYETGLHCLDKSMGGGLYPGKAYAICARMKVGKTTMAGTISYNLNELDVPHLFVAGEMSPVEIEQRNIARAIRRSPSEFLKSNKDDDFLFGVADYISTAQDNIIYMGKPGLTFKDLRQYVSRAKIERDISGFIVDYFQLIGGVEKGATTAEHQLNVAQWIADICREENLWALVTVQLNQEGNIRGGESIRLAFDQVYVLERKKEEPTAWMRMMETRYTPWIDVGSEGDHALIFLESGPYFKDLDDL